MILSFTMAETVINVDLNSSADAIVESIRNKKRVDVTTTRKQQRDDKLNRSRFALGQSVATDAYTEEYVIATTKDLKKKALNQQEYSKLQNALIQSKDHINAFFTVEHAVHALCRDISGKSPLSKLAAANCCCNLSLGNSKACATVCKFIAPYLIAELESSSEPLVEVCLWTIGNLSVGSDKAFSILHAQGCLKSIIKLPEQCSDNILSAISYAALRYIHEGGDVIEKEDIIRLCELIVSRYPKVSDTDTMWLLAELSSIPECTKFVLEHVPEICNYLQNSIHKEDENIEKISAALRIIANTASEPSGQVVHYLISDRFEKSSDFFEKLLSHQYVHIRNETLWLLGNLYNHCLDTVQQLVKLLIPTLPSLKLAMSSFNEVTTLTSIQCKN